MRHRIESLMGQSFGGMWVGTFHGLAHRLLRTHWQEAGLIQDFQILDSDDQLRLIKRINRELQIDDERWPAKQCQWYINGQKDEGLRASNIDDFGDDYTKTMLRIYRAYEIACDRGGMIDFGEILLRSHELWLKNPQILDHYQRRFQHILVDEFPRHQLHSIRVAARACGPRQPPDGGRATTISLSMAGAAPRSRIFSSSAAISRVRSWSNSSKTTARLKTFSTQANSLITNNAWPSRQTALDRGRGRRADKPVRGV
jgi:hypothetical protein